MPVNVPTIILADKRGVVLDSHLKGVRPSKETERFVRTSGQRVEIKNPRQVCREGSKTLEFEAYKREFAIDFHHAQSHLGGNALNTGAAIQQMFNTFDAYGVLIPGTTFHTLTNTMGVRMEVSRIFGEGQSILPSEPNIGRSGWYIPRQQSGESLYLSHTPDSPHSDYQIPGDPYASQDIFISSASPKSSAWNQILHRVAVNPATRLLLSPGRNQLEPELEEKILKATHLIALNKNEAWDLLARTNPNLLMAVFGTSKTMPNNKDLASILAKAVCIMGPRHALVTNGGSTVALYDSNKQELVTIEPPTIEEIRAFTRETLGRNLEAQEISLIGCGDTLLGVFIALEKLVQSGQLQLSTKEQLQVATTMARLHGWNPKPNIHGMPQRDIEKITQNAVTKMAA